MSEPNKEKNFISAVIYVHNNASHILEFIQSIDEIFVTHFEAYEIICVNDASSDDSLIKLKEIKLNEENVVSIINLPSYHGLEKAMKIGIDFAIGDFVCEFDHSILNFDPQLIIKLYETSLTGFDIVSAIPNQKPRLASRVFYKIIKKFSDINSPLTTERFRLLSRRAINRINAMHKEIPYRKAVYANCGLKKTSIFIDERTKPVYDKIEIRYQSELAINSILIFTDIGFKLSTCMSIAMILISLFMLIYSLIIYLSGNAITGWTTTILFLAVAFSGVFVISAIALKYLQLLLDFLYKDINNNYESIEKL